MCKSDNPPNCVVTISSSCEDRNNILELGTNAIESLGSNINNVVYASFSASGIKGFQRGSTYLQNHDVDSFSIISCDGCGSYEFLNDRNLSQDFAILKEKNVPITIIQGAQTYKGVYERLINNDYNAYYLTVDSSRRNHMTTNYDMSDNLLLYALGEVDDIPENTCNYQLFYKNFDGTVDMENIRCSDAGIEEGYDKNKYKDVLRVKSLGLSNLDRYNDNDVIGNGYVKADFNFITNSMNQIRSTISKTTIATKTPTLPIAGADGLLSTINGCISKYVDMTAILYSKINQETEATMSYSQSIIDLDLYQKEQAKNITSGVVTDNSLLTGLTATAATNVINSNTNTNINISTNNNPSTTTSNQTNNQQTNTSNSDGTITSNNQTSNEEKTNPNDQTTTEQPSNFTISGNDMIWKYDDGSTLTLTVENNKITNMKFNYEFSSNEEANNNVNNLLKGIIDKENFDKVEINDNKVQITIKKEFFESKSVDEIKNLYFKGGIK